MILLLDDIRDIKADKVCRNFQCACLSVLQYDFDVLYIDHDLGEYKTGYDFIKYCINNNISFKKVVIIPSNPIVRDNISFALKDDGYKAVNPYTLIKV